MPSPPKWVASRDLGDMSLADAVQRCVFRALCGHPESGREIRGVATLFGAPASLSRELVEQLYKYASQGETFLICSEFADTLTHVLRSVDAMAVPP